MRNPWLDIPLADYERHMALPQVAQAQLLSDVLAEAVGRYLPRSVAVLGCAGGNGFERLADNGVERIVGVDLNPDYVEAARERFADRIPVPELIAGDVQTGLFTFAPVDLVLAGLLFEYVDPGVVLARIRTMLAPGGTLRTLVQLPGTALSKITPSPYTSLAALAPVMHLVPPEQLARLAADQGYFMTGDRTVEAAGGKQFQVQDFRPR
jgi:SAM-dependent methyltransferase